MADMQSHGADHHGGVGGNPHVRHEQRDVNIRGILMFAAGLVAVAIVIQIAMWGLLRYFDARAARAQTVQFPLAVEQEQRLPPEPRLQTNPRQDLQDLRDAEQQLLITYGWVDRNAGIVRIPIDQAMKLTLQRGLPARQTNEPQR